MSHPRSNPYIGLATLATLALLLSSCSTSTPSASSSTSSGGNAEKADLTYWFWGNDDAPGANDWMKARIAEYHTLHPGVTVKMVIQSNDTLTGAFTVAAQSKSGPDIATQWPTMPVLSKAWAGAIVPLSDYVSTSARTNWIGTQENTDNGKLYAMPLYIIGMPMVYNKELFTKAGIASAPTTFTELLTDCRLLRAVGVTPIGGGNKSGYFGAWFFSNFGKQSLDSVTELKQALIGKTDITDPKYTGFYEPMHQLMVNHCFNDDIASLDLLPGIGKFGSGQAAITWGTDGMVAAWAKQLGENKVGVARTPKWGTGKLADVYNTTQDSSPFITSWSPNKQAAAQFLTWLHEPANLTSWYQATGTFPADTGFDPSNIKSPLLKQLWTLDATPGAVWLENYLPTSVDSDADLAAGQVITSGGSVQAAVTIWKKAVEKWRTQNPVEVKDFTAWATR